MGGDLAGTLGVDQAAAGDHDLLYLAEILAALHIGQAHHGVSLFHGAGVPGYGGLDSPGGQSKVQCLPGLIRGQGLGIGGQIVHHLLCLAGRNARQLADTSDAHGVYDTLDAVTHTDIALDRALDVGLGQALVNGICPGRHTVCDGVNICGGAAHVHGQQVTDAVLAFTAFSQQLHGLHHGGGGGHHNAGDQAGSLRQALGLNDLLQEDLADLLLGGLDVQHTELGHDVFTDVSFPVAQDALALTGYRTVAGNDDGKPSLGAAEHFCIMQNAGAVAAVGTAAQQEHVRLDAVDIFYVVFGQLKGKDLVDFCTGAQAGLLGGFCRQLGNQTAGDHLQAAGCGRTGVAMDKVQLAGLLLQQRHRIIEAVIDVGLHGGIACCSTQQALFLQIDRSHLGIGAAKVNQ